MQNKMRLEFVQTLNNRGSPKPDGWTDIIINCHSKQETGLPKLVSLVSNWLSVPAATRCE